ncbi:hypothetical protein T484DRAFT_3155618 [Baffinella frigidus]|nr:hypothetical protein T484DRAFT_3155618 [Cryptophyta sp. CCMP2293]
MPLDEADEVAAAEIGGKLAIGRDQLRLLQQRLTRKAEEAATAKGDATPRGAAKYHKAVAEQESLRKLMQGKRKQQTLQQRYTALLDQIVVIEPGSPAAASGKVHRGDVVHFIDGNSARNKSPEQVLALIQGQVGSAITLSVKASGPGSTAGSGSITRARRRERLCLRPHGNAACRRGRHPSLAIHL